MEGYILDTDNGETILQVSQPNQSGPSVASADDISKITKLHLYSSLASLNQLWDSDNNILENKFPILTELTIHSTVFDDEKIVGDGDFSEVDLVFLDMLSESKLSKVETHLPTACSDYPHKADNAVYSLINTLSKQQKEATFSFEGSSTSVFPFIKLTDEYQYPLHVPSGQMSVIFCPTTSPEQKVLTLEKVLGLYTWISRLPHKAGTNVIICGLENLELGTHMTEELGDFERLDEWEEKVTMWESRESWENFFDTYKGQTWHEIFRKAAAPEEGEEGEGEVAIKLGFQELDETQAGCQVCTDWNRKKEGKA